MSGSSSATAPRAPWPNSTRPAILTPPPRSTAARRHRRSTLNPTTPRGTAQTLPAAALAPRRLVVVAVAHRRLGPARRPRPPRSTGRCRPRPSAPLLEPTHDHDPAALGQRLGRMLGLVPPHDHGEERRLLLPPAAHGHPEHRPSDAGLGVPNLGVLGEVAGEADGCLGHGPALLNAWPGGLPCPWTRGTVDTVACARPPGASDRANEVGPTGSTADHGVGSGAGLVGGRLRLGVGHASPVRPDPSTLDVMGERGYSYTTCRRLLRRRGIAHTIPTRVDQRGRPGRHPGSTPADIAS